MLAILTFMLNPLDTNVTVNLIAQTSLTKLAWRTVAPSPVARSETASAVVDGKLYVFGGFIKSSVDPFPRPISRSDVYNPENNTWRRIADLPTPLTHTSTAVDGRNIYLAGGYPGKPTGGQRYATKAVWRYNVDTNTWLAMPTLPEARGGGALALLGRKLHFFGGSDINRLDKRNHWVLSLGDTRWTAAAPLPSPRNHLGDAVLGGKIYAIAGQRGQDSNSVTSTSVYMWNPAKPNIWTSVAPMPRPRSHIGAATFVMDGRIIVAGGEISHAKSVSDVTAYDPKLNSWKAVTPLPISLHSGAAGSIENQIFYTMGNNKGFFRTTTYKGVPVNNQALNRLTRSSGSPYMDTDNTFLSNTWLSAFSASSKQPVLISMALNNNTPQLTLMTILSSIWEQT